MDYTFYNYQFTVARSSWERGDWLSAWWRIDRHDPFFTPPPYLLLKRILNPARNPHLARLNPVFLFSRAVGRLKGNLLIDGPQGLNQGPPYANAPIEAPVAAVACLTDPRREDQTSYLGLLKCANDLDTLERLLDKLAPLIEALGANRIIGPTGLSPYLGSGLLVDGWNEPPPLYSPHNPPYLPEIVSGVMEPIGTARMLYSDLSTPGSLHPPGDRRSGEIRFRPLQLPELADDILPLFQAACQNNLGFPLPDRVEARFLIHWLSYWPAHGWVAELQGEPVGFILLQPDYASVLRKTGGGRRLPGRARLAWARQSAHPAQGRLVFGGVLPAFRDRGIGTRLWQQAVQFGHTQRWNSISIGPLEESSEAFALLQRHVAIPRQAYQIYQYQL